MNRLLLLAFATTLASCQLTTTPPKVQRGTAAPTPIVVIKDEPRGPIHKPRTDTPDERPILIGEGGERYRVRMVGRVGVKEYEAWPGEFDGR